MQRPNLPVMVDSVLTDSPSTISSPSNASSRRGVPKELLVFDPILLNANSPSRKERISAVKEDRGIMKVVTFLDKLMYNLWLFLPGCPPLPGDIDYSALRATALWYSHIYIATHSIAKVDYRGLALGSAFLAYKSSEYSPGRLKMSNALEALQRTLEPGNQLAQHHLERVGVMACSIEERLMWLTGFEFDLMLPFRYLDSIFHSLKSTIPADTFSILRKLAMNFLDDSFLGRSSLFFSGDVLAFAAVTMAAADLQLALPNLESSNQDNMYKLPDVCAEMRKTYKRPDLEISHEMYSMPPARCTRRQTQLLRVTL